MKMDMLSDVLAAPAIDLHDFVTDAEGNIVNIKNHTGVILAVLDIFEDATQAATELLDVTIHQVLDNTEVPVVGNQIAAFTQIVGSNGAAVNKREIIAIDLGVDLTPLANQTKPFLQMLMTETSTWEGMVSAWFILGGFKDNPVTQSITVQA